MNGLFERFQANRVEPAELEQLLLEVFHGARSTSNSEVVYPGNENEYAVRLRYRDGVLIDIHPGPALTAEQVDQVESRIAHELLGDAEERVGRVLLFAGVPTRGYFRYQDHFQIVPVPADAPRPPAAFGDHPAILEFRFRTTASMPIRFARRALREEELALLLNALLTVGVHTLGHNLRFHWVLVPAEQPEQWRSSFLQEMYTWPESPPLESDEFLPVDQVPPVPVLDAVEYYERIGLGPDRQVDVPDNLTEMLHRYFALDRSGRDRFLRAAFWLRHARAVHSYARSASFTALISAVEALMPPPAPGGHQCVTCGRATGPGPTARFAAFVNEFAPTTPQALRRRLYGIRSALSHGGSLLHSDRTLLAATLTPGYLEEWENLSAAYDVVRSVLVNWLVAHG